MQENESITLTVNGDLRHCSAGLTLAAYLEESGLAGTRLVAEINGQIVKSADFDQYILRSGDIVEFVRFVGGG
ncbi:MAG: sulfur carrier protein ThiS [Desulfovibrionaceae bacterium]|nr:sulfur carrier protein ThiS [Desulfovibrionaceae bacterium]